MEQNIGSYFETIVIPASGEQHPQLAEQMSIIVLGSQGLGIADHLSDLEAAVYLDDPLWREQGGQLQLLLNQLLQATCPCRLAGSVIAVWPRSWLLGGNTAALLSDDEDLSIEELFTVQENLIVWDPSGFLAGVRAATVPSRYPTWLWKKRLLVALKALLEDFSEFTLAVKRRHDAEAYILFGELLGTLLRIGFVINRQYYPWRTHLSWAFARLPQPTAALLTQVDRIVKAAGWEEKVAATKQMISSYRELMADTAVLPAIDLGSGDLAEELVWAERLKAWENPTWREWIKHCQQKAVRDGYDPGEFWVWSLWGWE